MPDGDDPGCAVDFLTFPGSLVVSVTSDRVVSVDSSSSHHAQRKPESGVAVDDEVPLPPSAAATWLLLSRRNVHPRAAFAHKNAR